ncbi:cellulose binding domain-containing protein [Herpetosiphon giganteus]|uniref:cellulose binding domain-containing protein n=1 Tax=Herpetosiphon giganteus TaxID=2029754 RepID=UPI00195935B6|nr:cellulose binding domain-containing protein [Herpetosiphon giganteus]MBM7843479.1 photosystem II stability/assembly factor-like uncharacterized protein [Herpetosiphon giganteus]
MRMLKMAAAVVVLFAGVIQAMVAVPQSRAASSQPYTWANAEIVGGGFVPGIVYNPTERNLVYARTDIGGAYRWNPTTKRWIPLTDWINATAWNWTGIESLATDPVEPNRLYLAAGTYTNDWTSANGAILRSNDKGNTWSRTDLPFKLGGNMPGRSMGERLAIDPNKNSVLYLGTRGQGLWRSTDYGVTWAKVTSFSAIGNYTDPYFGDRTGVVWVTFDPRSSSNGSASQVIYAGVVDTTTSIYRSTDGGATWAALAGQPTAGYFPHHATLASNGMLYITYSDTPGPYDGGKGDVWKYNTANQTWTNISPIPSSSADNYFGYGGLAVDAQNPNTLVVSSLNSWWPDALLYRSTDGGATWSGIWSWGNYPERIFRYTQDISTSPWLDFGGTANAPEVAPKLGWMIGDIEIDPFDSNTMLYGTGATIYGTSNLTAWDTGGKVALDVRAHGLEETAVLDLISPPSGANLVSSLGDIAGFYHTSLNVAPSWSSGLQLGTSTGIDFAEKMPTTMARVGYVSEGSTTKKLACSWDGGKNWSHASSEPTGAVGGGKVAVAADGASIIWSGTTAPVSVASGCGNSWTASAGIPSGAVVVADRVNPKTFYGIAAGSFYRSTDGGLNFSLVASNLPAETTKIKAVPGIEGDVWLAGRKDGLYHSTNGGTSFSKIAGVEVANVVGFGKAAPGQSYQAIYITGTIDGAEGFFRSDDGGTTWLRINDDQHQYGSTNETITGDPRIYGRVYIGTNGRGIIYGDIAGSIPTTTPAPATATATRVPATATSVPATATATRVPATGTPTFVPATGTPTVTSVPPTATVTRVPATTTPTALPFTPTPTRVPTATSTPPAGGCRINYVVNQWNTGFTGNLTITNLGAPISGGWTLTWNFANSQTISSSWNTVLTQTGSAVTAKHSADWNANIATNGTQSFGFIATHNGTNAVPSNFVLNGVACSVAP